MGSYYSVRLTAPSSAQAMAFGQRLETEGMISAFNDLLPGCSLLKVLLSKDIIIQYI